MSSLQKAVLEGAIALIIESTTARMDLADMATDRRGKLANELLNEADTYRGSEMLVAASLLLLAAFEGPGYTDTGKKLGRVAWSNLVASMTSATGKPHLIQVEGEEGE